MKQIGNKNLKNLRYKTTCNISFNSNEAFNTYSMNTYVLLHFEHKNYVTIIAKFCIELRAVIYWINAAQQGATCRHSSRVVKLKIRLLPHLCVLQ